LHHINRQRSADHYFDANISSIFQSVIFVYLNFKIIMASKTADSGAAEHQEETHIHETTTMDEKYPTGNIRQFQAASIALAAATAAQKPSL
jgi:hypothetical protein